MDSNDARNETRHSAAHYFLEGLNELGFDYLFCNFGTDHAPLIEAMAAFRRAGRDMPATILCPHENTAVHMAAGYAIATGRGQGVMVHVDAGTANSAMALHNLCRARIPVMLMAGKAPFTTRGELLGTRDTYVHFVQEPFDQASVVRPYTKWEYNLPSGVIAKEVLRRAHMVMESDPKGPVYLTFPRETLTETWGEGADPLLSGRALRRRFSARRRRRLDRGAGGEALGGRAAAADHVLCRAQPRHVRRARRAGALRRHPRRRIQSALRQLSHESPCHGGFMPAKALARPMSACWSMSTCRGSERHAGQSRDLVGADRHRRREAQFPDLDLFPATCACPATAIASSSDLLAR
jgi:acetolactate synthase-1/2/3 large subunit